MLEATQSCLNARLSGCGSTVCDSGVGRGAIPTLTWTLRPYQAFSVSPISEIATQQSAVLVLITCLMFSSAGHPHDGNSAQSLKPCLTAVSRHLVQPLASTSGEGYDRTTGLTRILVVRQVAYAGRQAFATAGLTLGRLPPPLPNCISHALESKEFATWQKGHSLHGTYSLRRTM